MRKKISIFGAGNVGSALGQLLASSGTADLVLVDVVPGRAEGKALDLAQATPLYQRDIKIIGGENSRLIKNSNLVVITAGAVRKPGMSRDELLEINARIVQECARAIKKYAPKALVIVVSNPLDAMTWLCYKILGFKRERVMGMAGVLDSARFKYLLAQKLGASVKDLQAMVLGGHGDDMVPVLSTALWQGQRIDKLLSPKELKEIVQKTRNAGAEIVAKMQTSAFFSPSASIFEMIKAIFKDEKRLLPCSVIVQGEYGFKGIALGLPVILGARGVERIVELKLSRTEQKALEKSAQRVKNLIKKLNSLKI